MRGYIDVDEATLNDGDVGAATHNGQRLEALVVSPSHDSVFVFRSSSNTIAVQDAIAVQDPIEVQEKSIRSTDTDALVLSVGVTREGGSGLLQLEWKFREGAYNRFSHSFLITASHLLSQSPLITASHLITASDPI